MLYLGTNLKELRMKTGMTQEELSYELGVSSQTVSRWENGTTYPDIVMLPILAEFFGVTIDTLMGYARECATGEREAFFRRTRELSREERIQAHREMLSVYPNDVVLQFSLANLLYGCWKKDQSPDTEKEIERLCHRVLNADRVGLQCGAMRLLALLAAEHGDEALAMKYVNELPSVCCGREIMEKQILEKMSFQEALRDYMILMQ